MNVEAEFHKWLRNPDAHVRKHMGTELKQLLDAIEPDGTYSLTLYRADGMCWVKRGECRLTPKSIEQLRQLVETAAQPSD